MRFIDKNGNIHSTWLGAVLRFKGDQVCLEKDSTSFEIPTVEEVKDVLKDKRAPFLVDYNEDPEKVEYSSEYGEMKANAVAEKAAAKDEYQNEMVRNAIIDKETMYRMKQFESAMAHHPAASYSYADELERIRNEVTSEYDAGDRFGMDAPAMDGYEKYCAANVAETVDVDGEDSGTIEVTKECIKTAKSVHIHPSEGVIQLMNENGEIVLASKINDGIVLPDLDESLVGSLFFPKENIVSLDDFMKEYRSIYEDVYSKAEGSPIGDIKYIVNKYGMSIADADDLVGKVIDMMMTALVTDPYHMVNSYYVVSKDMREYIKRHISGEE